MSEVDGLIGMPEACKIFGVGRSSLYRMIEDGRIPTPAKLGEGSKSRVVWRRSVLMAALDEIMPSAPNA